MKRLQLVALTALVLGALVVAGRSDGPRSDASRVEHLSEQLRCPVCDGLAVADSPSSTARAIAADVRDRVARGETDDQIRDAYVSQYGTWILLEPPGSGIGTLAWLLPGAGVVAAVAAGGWTVYRRSMRATAKPSASARATVAAALEEAR